MRGRQRETGQCAQGHRKSAGKLNSDLLDRAAAEALLRMGHLVTVATCSLNQWSLDFDGAANGRGHADEQGTSSASSPAFA